MGLAVPLHHLSVPSSYFSKGLEAGVPSRLNSGLVGSAGLDLMGYPSSGRRSEGNLGLQTPPFSQDLNPDSRMYLQKDRVIPRAERSQKQPQAHPRHLFPVMGQAMLTSSLLSISGTKTTWRIQASPCVG